MRGESMSVRRAGAADAGAIAEIYNQGILGRNATYETVLRTEEDRRQLLLSASERHPTLVVEAEGQVTGWANISNYRTRECYRGVGEYSVYVHQDWRGHGVGRRLLEALIEEARRLGYWKLLSRVFPENNATRALCRKCGFREVGTYEKHAQLDGVWRDVIIVERLIGENQT